jgi:hypothetical protein
VALGPPGYCRPMGRRSSALVFTASFTALACGGGASSPSATDAGAALDAGAQGGGDAGASALDAGAEVPDAGPASDAGEPAPDAGPEDAGHPLDPFAPQPDLSEGLTNVSDDLDALLEHGALPGACAAWEADPGDRRKLLLCGKSMFFYEAFGTQGVPSAIVDFLGQNLTDVVGPGWSNYGMIPDPTSAEGRPLGLAPGAPLGDAPSVAFTCASCHLAQLPDGRYAVGAANHRYDYGGQLLALMLAPTLLRPGADPADHHPDAVARVQALTQRFAADRPLRLRFLTALLPLLGAAAPTMDRATEGHYAHWLTGTMDFLIAPLPVDDQVHTVSKIGALHGLPGPEEQAQAGMRHAMLGWSGVATSLLGFLRGFVIFGGGPADEWPTERLRPLEQYILSLQAPEDLTPPPADAVARGAALFQSQGCLTCHSGPRGSGLDLYTYEELGTDPEMKRWLDPELDGTPCCGVPLQPDEEVTHALKSPRLVGLWAMQRFLHNGAVESLESLLCLGAPRGGNTEPAYGDGGHTYGCALGEAERRDLVAFLRAH